MAQAEVLNQESLAKQVLQETFGYQQFRPGQETIIETALEGRDCLVVMPTGGGKSLCYQVPALVLNGLTVVVSPLISLMKDQVDQLLANGVAAACLNSTQTREQQQEVMAGCRTGQIRLLYIAPERLMLETDSPYLSPVPLRGKRNEPSHLVKTAEFIAKLRNVSLQQLSEITTNTAISFFNIPGLKKKL